MPSFSRIALFVILLFVSQSCTVYTEKQTETVSQVVYATKDSIDKARFDLADGYITETTRLIRPPKTRLDIQSLSEPVHSSQKTSKSARPTTSKAPVVIVPERLRGLKIMVVNSEEYTTLVKDKETHEQLRADYSNLDAAKKLVDEEIITQSINRDKMVVELNLLKETISSKNVTILKLTLTCVSLGAGLVGIVVLKIKGII